MKFILTGITGNMGYEVAKSLLQKGHIVIPIIRASSKSAALERIWAQDSDFLKITDCINTDLEKNAPTYKFHDIDCIVHCAGVVHFRKSGNSNELMMRNILILAKILQVKIYYVSTAYLHKPNNEPLFNGYEIDKFQSENLLTESSIPYTIFRPSIITGNSKTGKIIHFSAYYPTIHMFTEALNGINYIRFPNIENKINIIPVDWIAESIVNTIGSNDNKILFITNPNPPMYKDLLFDTLRYYGLNHKLKIVDLTFAEYEALDLSYAERKLINSYKPFIPYVTTNYDFPSSLCKKSLDDDYISKILTYFEQMKNEK